LAIISTPDQNSPNNEIPSELDRKLDMKLEIISSPEYLNECKKLEAVFVKSREIGIDPVGIFAVQEQLFHSLLQYQRQKKENKKNEKVVYLYNTLIEVTKSIADSVAWRALNYNRFLAELFTYHPQTGALDPQSSLVELEKARQILEEEGAIVILNDLTNFLRQGDLSVISNGNLRLIEVKAIEEEGKTKKAKSARIVDQRRELKKFNDFLSGETEYINISNINHFVMPSLNKPPRTFHSYLEDAIQEAKSNGYSIRRPLRYLSIEILDYDVINPDRSNDKLLLPHSDEYKIELMYDNVMPVDDKRDMGSSAPFGIFPLSDEDCFKLINGRLRMKTTLYPEGLEQLFKNYGIDLKKSYQSESDKKVYIEELNNNPAGSKKRGELEKGGFWNYFLISRHYTSAVDMGFWAKLLVDLINPRDIATVEKMKADKLRVLETQGQMNPKTTRVHIGYDERSIWK
jgi:hypothetical protein